MRRGAISLIALLGLLWSAACAQPRIDASSERRFKESIEEVRASLPADERGQFDTSLQLIAYTWVGDVVRHGVETFRDELAAELQQEEASPRGVVEAPDRSSPTLSERAEEEPTVATLMQSLDGLTGRQVIERANTLRSADSDRQR